MNKTNKSINTAVIGLGVGMHHARFYEESEKTKLQYIVEIDAQKRQLAKNKFPNVRVVSDYKSVIEDNDIDAISIASYDDAHYSQIIDALQANKHIFVEKPLCQNDLELEDIFAQYNKTEHLIMGSNFPLRTTPRFVRLKEQIQANEFGEVLSLNLSYIWGRPEKILNGWRLAMSHYSLVQGALIHMLDLAHFILNKWPKEIIGMGGKKGIRALKKNKLRKDIDDNVGILLKYEDGTIAYLNAQSLSCHPHFHGVNIFGSKQSYVSTIKEGFYIDNLREDNTTYQQCDSDYPARGFRTLSLEQFISAIIYQDRTLLLHQDLYQLMRLVFKCEEAIKGEQKVFFS